MHNNSLKGAGVEAGSTSHIIMVRRKGGLLSELVKRPWWVSVCVSLGAYFCLTTVLPALLSDSPITQAFATAFQRYAGFLSLILLIPAPISAFNAWRKRRLLGAQDGLESIQRLNWKQFEELVAQAYRQKGYYVIENHRGGPDGGVDVRIRKDEATYLVQCKHWKSRKIGVKIVRELYGVVAAEKATGGILVSSGSYTDEAIMFAEQTSIDLVDGRTLEVLIGLVKTLKRRAHKINTATHCPQCGNTLVLRKARRGRNAGSTFVGCSSYPRCRYTKSTA